MQTNVIDFPYSDHRLVLAELAFNSEKPIPEQKLKRKLNEITIAKIVDELKNTNFSFLAQVSDVDNYLFFFERLVMQAVDKFAPLKNCKVNKKNPSLPWYDSELYRMNKRVNKLYIKYKKCLTDKASYDSCLKEYQTLLRQKKINYFKDKSSKDLKNSKKFYEIYRAHMKMRSDKSGQIYPDHLIVNDEKITEKVEIERAFIKHFSSFESEKDVSDVDCKKFIFETLKLSSNTSQIKNDFNFIPTDESEV